MSQKHSSPQTETNSYAAVVSGAVVMLAFGVLLMGSLSNRTHVPYTPPAEASIQPTPTLMTQLPKLNVITYSAIDVASGASQFGAVCSGCHASDARGIPGLGKNLVESEFVSDLKDDELFQFITVGRPAYDSANTTGIDMPARGGNPALTDQNLHQIIAYIRTLKDPSLISEPGSEVASLPQATRTPVPLVGTSQPFAPLDLSSLSVGSGSQASQPQIPLPTAAATTPVPTEVAGISTETGSSSEFDAAGSYAFSCSGCHGGDGTGVAGLTERFYYNPLVMSRNTGSLLDFLIVGNSQHPPRGGYPELSDDQLRALIDYLYALTSGQ